MKEKQLRLQHMHTQTQQFIKEWRKNSPDYNTCIHRHSSSSKSEGKTAQTTTHAYTDTAVHQRVKEKQPRLQHMHTQTQQFIKEWRKNSPDYNTCIHRQSSSSKSEGKTAQTIRHTDTDKNINKSRSCKVRQKWKNKITRLDQHRLHVKTNFKVILKLEM